jgi:hypothetical protein
MWRFVQMSDRLSLHRRLHRADMYWKFSVLSVMSFHVQQFPHTYSAMKETRQTSLEGQSLNAGSNVCERCPIRRITY